MTIRLLTSIMAFFVCSANVRANSDFLWNKMNDICIPKYRNNGIYKPCALIDLNEKYVIYKTDFDKYQYLLLPTDKISGTEDVKLQQDDVPNYFYLAWQSRVFLTERFNKPIKEQLLSLTINPKNTREQHQLHIHISCLSAEAHKIISGIAVDQLDGQWSSKQVHIAPYSYFYRKINFHELKNENLFKSIKAKVEQENGNMDYTGVALVNIDPNNFLLLAGIGTKENGYSAELLQEHECKAAQQ
jgi:CDP-diacylglycerol pyrophosphatase